MEGKLTPHSNRLMKRSVINANDARERMEDLGKKMEDDFYSLDSSFTCVKECKRSVPNVPCVETQKINVARAAKALPDTLLDAFFSFFLCSSLVPHVGPA